MKVKYDFEKNKSIYIVELNVFHIKVQTHMNTLCQRTTNESNRGAYQSTLFIVCLMYKSLTQYIIFTKSNYAQANEYTLSIN